MMNGHPWWKDAFFYHIYPLGFCGCPRENDFKGEPVHRIARIHEHLDHLQELGVNALLIGPLFESSSHGYDTADFLRVDRRLGDWDSLRALGAEARRRGMRVVLDGVFNHVGRDFWAFRDVQEKGSHSAYRSWFSGVTFDRCSKYGDAFAYDGWGEDHFELVKLEHRNPDVRSHIYSAARRWFEELDIDGLRLDVACELDSDFMRELSEFCRGLGRPLWLMGEMVHGDYRQWVGEARLDSGTNYECFHSLWSGHADTSYLEIARSLNRMFGPHGIYRNLHLYNFCDNHDVSRVASLVQDGARLYPLHVLLFTMPGIPSIYYGSEWGIPGEKQKQDDWNLRPDLDAALVSRHAAHPHLAPSIARLAAIRRECPALRHGEYVELHVSHEQLAFARRSGDDEVIVAVNRATEPIALDLPESRAGVYGDLLNPGREYSARDGRLFIDHLDPTWGCILRRRPAAPMEASATTP